MEVKMDVQRFYVAFTQSVEQLADCSSRDRSSQAARTTDNNANIL